MWRARRLLRALPEGASVPVRWAADRDAFTAYQASIVDGAALPQPRVDSAVAAAGRLDRLEREQARYDAQRALDDPLVMAEFRLAGEAFAGTVVAADPNAATRPASDPCCARTSPSRPATRCSSTRGRASSRRPGRPRRRPWSTSTAAGRPRAGRRDGPQADRRRRARSPSSASPVTLRTGHRRLPAARPPARAARPPRGRTAARPPSTCRRTPTPGRSGRDATPPTRSCGLRHGARRGVVVDSPPGAGKSTLVVRAAQRAGRGRRAADGRRADQRAGRRPHRPARRGRPGAARSAGCRLPTYTVSQRVNRSTGRCW